MKKLLLKHKPQVNIKSYCVEVFQCQCGLTMKKDDKASWDEWAAHVERCIEVDEQFLVA